MFVLLEMAGYEAQINRASEAKDNKGVVWKMVTGLKVRLEPNNEQKSKLFKSAGAARWAYNWTLEKQEENYKNGGKFISNF